MPQIEPHDREWVVSAALALAHIVSGIRRTDHPAIAEAVTELLNAATRYVDATRPERPRDEALARAISRLS